jgi:hypothetical protein
MNTNPQNRGAFGTTSPNTAQQSKVQQLYKQQQKRKLANWTYNLRL